MPQSYRRSTRFFGVAVAVAGLFLYGACAGPEHSNPTDSLLLVQAIKGVDLDENGIRDEVDYFISKQHYAEARKPAVEQLARAVQATLIVDLTDRNALRAVNEQANRALHCVWSRFSDDVPQASRAVTDVEVLTANTKARASVYQAYNKALNGTVAPMPQEDTCETQ